MYFIYTIFPFAHLHNLHCCHFIRLYFIKMISQSLLGKLDVFSQLVRSFPPNTTYILWTLNGNDTKLSLSFTQKKFIASTKQKQKTKTGSKRWISFLKYSFACEFCCGFVKFIMNEISFSFWWAFRIRYTLVSVGSHATIGE